MNRFINRARAVLIFFALMTTTDAAPIKETDIIGTWHIITNLGYEEIVFAADHTFSAVCVGVTTGKKSGTWRIETNELVKKWTGGTITALGERIEADGTEKREELHTLEGDTLKTQIPGQFHSYERGPLPKDYPKPK